MASWRPALGLVMVLAGLVLFAAGGLYDVWWSWILGIVAAVALIFGGMGVFFTGIMTE